MLGAVGCDEDERSPERTIHRFLKAATVGDSKEVYDLLAPDAQKELRQRAQLATAQTGGRQRFSPQDLLATTLTSPEHDLGRVEVIEASGDHAKVRLHGPKGKHSEIWALQRVDGRWRVKLPRAALKRE